MRFAVTQGGAILSVERYPSSAILGKHNAQPMRGVFYLIGNDTVRKAHKYVFTCDTGGISRLR